MNGNPISYVDPKGELGQIVVGVATIIGELVLVGVVRWWDFDQQEAFSRSQAKIAERMFYYCLHGNDAACKEMKRREWGTYRDAWDAGQLAEKALATPETASKVGKFIDVTDLWKACKDWVTRH